MAGVFLLNALYVLLTIFTFLMIEPFVKLLFRGNLDNLSPLSSYIVSLVGDVIPFGDLQQSMALIIICAAVLYFLRNLSAYSSQWVMAHVRSDFLYTLRNRLYDKMISSQGQMGNSEVGHLNIGAGRIVYQELTRITKSIEDGDFFENPAFLKAVENCKAHDSALHLFGLCSDGGVHSHLEHLYALVELAKRNGLTKVYIHCFMDGRDTPPKSGKGWLCPLLRHSPRPKSP